MPIVEKVSNVDGLYLVNCPACKMLHQIHTKHKSGHNWSFDGNMEKPTFHPSLLVTYTWGEEQKKVICHSFIRNGVWDFLGDCTHDMAGQKVPMIDVDEEDYENCEN